MYISWECILQSFFSIKKVWRPLYVEFQPQESKEHSVHYSFNKRVTINLCQACPLQQEMYFCYFTNSGLVPMERIKEVNYMHIQGSS